MDCAVTNASAGTSYEDLNAAMRAAARGSTLLITGTCLGPSSRRDPNANFVIDRDLTLKGVATKDSGPPTLDGGLAATVVWVNRGRTVTLIGLTLTNGLSTMGNGGGLFNDGGVVTLDHSTVTANRAWVAGGIENSFGGVLTLTHSDVSANRSQAGGGGIYNGGTLTIRDSTVRGNTSIDSAGGGILNFANALYPGSGILTVLNSTISKNTSARGGGGIFNQASKAGVGVVTISSSTIRDNETVGDGGGILNVGILSFVAPATTIGGNTGWHAGGVANSPEGSVTGGCPTILGEANPASTTTGGLVGYDPSNSPTDYAGFSCARAILDQASESLTHSIALAPASSSAAQTFTAGVSGVLETVELWLDKPGSVYTDIANVRIESVEDGMPTGTTLAVADPVTLPRNGWIAFAFPSPASVVAGRQYAITLVAPTPAWAISDADTYPGGQAVMNGLPRPAEDWGFRTYVTPP